MPKYYTPKRPAIRFANSGSAMQYVSTQRVEKIGETSSDKATLTQDFSGAPRFPRRSYDTVLAYDPSGALAQPMAFPMGPQPLLSTGSNFIRYSFLPVTDYLQAQQHGIYDLTADNLGMYTNQGTPSSSLDVSSNSGSVIYDVALTGSTLAYEVVQWNAFLSGSELKENIYNGLPSIYYSGSSPGIFVPSYYAKTAAINNLSLRTVYSISKRIPTVNDLVYSPPSSAPSASSGSAPGTVSASISASAYKGQIGVYDALVQSGTTFTLVTNPWNWNIIQPAITGTAASSATILAAATNNLVYWSAMSGASLVLMTASIVSSVFNGPLLSMTLGSASFPMALLTASASSGTLCFIHSWVPLQSETSGTYINNTPYEPAMLPVSLTQSGRIRDLRAWVEFIHDNRSAAAYQSQDDWGLQGVAVTLRSPNTSFHSSHPLWNSNQNLPIRTQTDLSGVANKFGQFYYEVPELFKNSYLLWQGHGVDDGLRDTLSSSPSTIGTFYHEFDKDIDMRTIFWDGSKYPNPRDISALYPSASSFFIGANTNSYSYFEDWSTYMSTSLYQSPTVGALKAALANSAPSIGSVYGWQAGLTCSDTPWMLDTRVNMGQLEPLRSTADINKLSPSPPGGWLTGRGGMLPWLAITSTNHSTVSIGSGDRMFIRSDANLVYVFGGRNAGSLVPVQQAWYVPYEPDEAKGVLAVSGDLYPVSPGLPGAAYGYQAFHYYHVISGSAAISNNSTERILMVGGAQLTGTGGCNEVFVGHWISGSKNITWTRSNPLPTSLEQHNVYVRDGYAYVSPGISTSDTGITTRVTAAFSAPVDQQTGLVGSWTTHLLPSASSFPINKILAVGSGTNKSAISYDAGYTWSVLPDTTHNFQHMTLLTASDPDKFIACSRDGYLGYTTDSGQTWTWSNSARTYLGSDVKLNKVFSSSNGLIAIGSCVARWNNSTWAGGPTFYKMLSGTGYPQPQWYNIGLSLAETNTTTITTAGTAKADGGLYEFSAPVGSDITVVVSASNQGSILRYFGADIWYKGYYDAFWIPAPYGILFTVAAYSENGTGFSYIPVPKSGSTTPGGQWSVRVRPYISSTSGWVGTAQVRLTGNAIQVRPIGVEMYDICQGATNIFGLDMVVAVGGIPYNYAPPNPTLMSMYDPPVRSAEFAGDRQTVWSFDGGVTWASGVMWDQASTGTLSTTWGNKTYRAIYYNGSQYIAGEYYGGMVTSSNAIIWKNGAIQGALSGVEGFVRQDSGPYAGTVYAYGSQYYKSSSPSMSKYMGWTMATPVPGNPAYPTEAQRNAALGAEWAGLSTYSEAPIHHMIHVADNIISAGDYLNDYINPSWTPGAIRYQSSSLMAVGSWLYPATAPAFAVRSLAAVSGTTLVGSLQPLFSFFDSFVDATGTNRHFGWTTYNATEAETGPNLSSNSQMKTFRYELRQALTSWTGNFVNDSAIQEVSYTSSYYPTVVDNNHRAWAVGQAGESARYSVISWDDPNNRPKMSAATPGGLANSEAIGQGFRQFRAGAIATLSGIMAAGLCDVNHGSTNSWKVAGVTAFFGVGPGPGEFDTYGYQLGPQDIRPVYSLLDDIYAYKLSDQTPGIYGAFSLASNRASVIGFRPGLRGSEVNGTWNFMFGTAASHTFDINNGYAAQVQRGIWVRQVRLETVVDQGIGVFYQNPARARLYGRSTIVPAPDGPRLNTIQSGSTAWDIGLVSYQTYQFPDYGRTVSISANQSGTSDDYAVLTYITGNLYAELSSSGVLNPSAPSWFLGGVAGRNFGTPYIPDSLMSLGTGSAELVDASASAELYNNTINIQKTVSPAITTTDLMNKSGVTKTTFDLALQTVISQSNNSGSGYFPPFPP